MQKIFTNFCLETIESLKKINEETIKRVREEKPVPKKETKTSRISEDLPISDWLKSMTNNSMHESNVKRASEAYKTTWDDIH